MHTPYLNNSKFWLQNFFLYMKQAAHNPFLKKTKQNKTPQNPQAPIVYPTDFGKIWRPKKVNSLKDTKYDSWGQDD